MNASLCRIFKIFFAVLVLVVLGTLPVFSHSNFLTFLHSSSFVHTGTTKVAFLTETIVIEVVSFGALGAAFTILRWGALLDDVS